MSAAAGIAGLTVGTVAWFAWQFRAAFIEDQRDNAYPIPAPAEIRDRQAAERGAGWLIWPDRAGVGDQADYTRWHPHPNPPARWFTGGPMPEDKAAFAVGLASRLNAAGRSPGWLRPIAANVARIEALEAERHGEVA